jgi:subtilisin family serine protease
VLVGYRKGASATQRDAARRAVKAGSHRSVSPLALGLERLTLEPEASVRDAVRVLRKQPGVRFAEPDYVVGPDHLPNDDLYYHHILWGIDGPSSIHASPYGSGASEAWKADEIGSRSVFVGIVDTGIDFTHKDLAPNIWTNPFETAANGVDDDGNGYIDDVHGWDFFHDDASVYDAAAVDYHGTHVAGTIGAVGGNDDEGAVGVNWAVTMIPAKFIHGEGTISGAIAALDYLTDLKTRHGLNIVATNNSWGGAEETVALEDAINRGGDAGILFVAAAGNDGEDIDVTPTYPAAHECVTRYDTGDPRGFDCLISVAAITSSGALASFSNYGSTSVDIGAPGQKIASTFPGNRYAYMDGTSMATPHVTGALALLTSCEAASTPDGLRQSLFDAAVATGSLNGTTSTGDRISIGGMMADCDTGGPPRVLITTRAGGTDAPAIFWLWFSEPITGLEPSDLTISGTSTGWSVESIASVPGQPSGPYFVTLAATSPPPGGLRLKLAANSVTGANGLGPATPASVVTVIDRSAPTISALGMTILPNASLDGSAIPIRLTWSGTDTGTGIRKYVVGYSTNGGSSWNILSQDIRTPGVDLLVDPSGSLRFRVQSVDWADHGSPLSTGPTFSPRLVQESATAITYSGAWTRSTSSLYSGGAVRNTSVGGRSATYSFTGRGVAFVTTRSATRGVVKIKLDGVQVARIDLGTSPNKFRHIVWSRVFSTVKAHKVQVIVVGTYGRVDLDAFAVLK